MLSKARGLTPLTVAIRVTGPLIDHSMLASIVSMRDGGISWFVIRRSSVRSTLFPSNAFLVTPGSCFDEAEFIGRPDPTAHRSIATSSPTVYCHLFDTRKLDRPIAARAARDNVKIPYVNSG